MRIRTKLFITIMCLVLLLNALGFYLYNSSQRSMGQYNQLLQRFFLLNEMSQEANITYQKLQSYFNEHSSSFYKQYNKAFKTLNHNKNKLNHLSGKSSYETTLENEQHMIDSFLAECTMAMHAFREGNVNLYSEHLSEAEKILGYIHDTTLTLINGELSNYQTFYYQMNQKNDLFKYLGLSLFVTTFLFSILFTFWFSRGITRPIRFLEEAAKEIAAGDFTVKDVPVTTKDELKLLTATFNHMKNNTRRLVSEIQEQSEQDRLMKEMELKSLQNQMNPHFLFNTLNTISKTAYLEDADQTHQLINATAKLLRHNLRELNGSVTLVEEIKGIEAYFMILNYRFQDRLTYHLHIEEDVWHTKMPVMILQPIVENAFIHGLEPYDQKGHIEVKARRHGSQVNISIKDNGIGMSQEQVKRILSDDSKELTQSKKSHSTGLGLKNVKRRLDIYYKSGPHLTIQTERNKGTEMTICLPLER